MLVASYKNPETIFEYIQYIEMLNLPVCVYINKILLIFFIDLFLLNNLNEK